MCAVSCECRRDGGIGTRATMKLRRRPQAWIGGAGSAVELGDQRRVGIERSQCGAAIERWQAERDE